MQIEASGLPLMTPQTSRRKLGIMAQALTILALIIALAAAPTVQAQQEQDSLVRVQARGFDEAYLAPDANLSGSPK